MDSEDLLLNVTVGKPKKDSVGKPKNDSVKHKKDPFQKKKKSGVTIVKPSIPAKRAFSEFDAALYDAPLKKKKKKEQEIKSSKVSVQVTDKSKRKFVSDKKPSANQSNPETKRENIASLVKEAVKATAEKEVTEGSNENRSQNSLFTGVSFKESPLHPYLVDNIEKSWGIKEMTEVQRQSIPHLLEGKDALIHWQTGSGKTLAYALPLIHRLGVQQPRLTRSDGIRAIIVLPTRELAVQTYQNLLTLVKSFAWLVVGCVVGGERRKAEKARLRRGLTIIVGTPTRLLDHIDSTAAMRLNEVNTLILDEADRLVELGYQTHVSRLIEALQKSREVFGQRQTVLLSATLTPGVEKLAGLALHDPLQVADATNSPALLPPSLDQRVVITPVRLRLVTLIALIMKHLKVDKCEKMMVFVATQDMVECLELLLAQVGLPTRIFKLHGSMTQLDRTQVFTAFLKSSSSVLIATDVAGRGLDVPAVGAVIQFTGPFDITDYIHRVGRTARSGRSGRATLVLSPNEQPLIEIMSQRGIKVPEQDLGEALESIYHLDFGDTKPRDLEDAATSLQLKLERAVEEDTELRDIAAKGFTSFVRFYATYPRELREAFDFRKLHLGHYAKSFALREPPSSLAQIKGVRMPKRPPVDKHREKSGKLNLSQISEYSSGLDSLPKKKKKKN